MKYLAPFLKFYAFLMLTELAGFWLWTLITVQVKGRIVLVEPNPVIRWAELISCALLVILGLFNLINSIRKGVCK
jgi:ABC-type nickel/cobalt efflux system permease component RcnA